MLQYSVAIATRNRHDALSISLPSVVSQSRLPAEIIVVDSSDDHQKTVALLSNLLRDYRGKVQVVKSGPGSVFQRNMAVSLANSDVIMLPDDDSVFYPGAAESIMDVYEKDTGHNVAAVCGVEELIPPEFLRGTPSFTYRVRSSERVRRRIARVRYAIEDSLVPDPARVLGRELIGGSCLPGWVVTSTSTKPVEWMTGFRMTFRANVIKESPFDDAFTGYSLFEDTEASFAAWKKGAVVGALNAKIYHHKSPERREAGLRLGVTQILNKAYVIAKHSSKNSKAKQAMDKFIVYKQMQYALGAREKFGRERFKGALLAGKYARGLLRAPLEDLKSMYKSALTDIGLR